MRKLFFSSLKDDYTGAAPKRSEGRGQNFHAVRERCHTAPELHGRHKPSRDLTTVLKYHGIKSLDDYELTQKEAAFNKPRVKKRPPIPTGSSLYSESFASRDGLSASAMDMDLGFDRQSRFVLGCHSRQTPASTSRHFHRNPENLGGSREKLAARDHIGPLDKPYDFLNSLYKVDIGGRKASGTGRKGIPAAPLRGAKSLSLLMAGTQTEEDAQRTYSLSLLKSMSQSTYTFQGL